MRLYRVWLKIYIFFILISHSRDFYHGLQGYIIIIIIIIDVAKEYLFFVRWAQKNILTIEGEAVKMYIRLNFFFWVSKTEKSPPLSH